MKKSLISLFIVFLFGFLVSCTQKTLYVTPEAVGSLYNSKTQQPIVKYSGFIGFSIARDEHNAVITDSRGRFKIAPETLKYYVIRHNLRDWGMAPTHIYIQFPGYKTKIYDYSEKYQEQASTLDSGFETLTKIDVGIIYLDPE